MKRLVNLFLLLLPCIFLTGIYFFYTFIDRSDATFIQFGTLLGILIVLGYIGGFVAVAAYSTTVVTRMSWVEASIWNLFIKVSYMLIYFYFLKFTIQIWGALMINGWILLFFGWIPLLIMVLYGSYLEVISGIFSVGTYIDAGNNGIWSKGIMILFCFLSFIVGINIIIAVIHIFRCIMKKGRPQRT